MGHFIVPIIIKVCLETKGNGRAQKKDRFSGALPTALIKLATSRTRATFVPLLASADALLSSAFLRAFATSFCIFSRALALFSSSFLYIMSKLLFTVRNTALVL